VLFGQFQDSFFNLFWHPVSEVGNPPVFWCQGFQSTHLFLFYCNYLILKYTQDSYGKNYGQNKWAAEAALLFFN
jgi:hypothetical protein